MRCLKQIYNHWFDVASIITTFVKLFATEKKRTFNRFRFPFNTLAQRKKLYCRFNARNIKIKKKPSRLQKALCNCKALSCTFQLHRHKSYQEYELSGKECCLFPGLFITLSSGLHLVFFPFYFAVHSSFLPFSFSINLLFSRMILNYLFVFSIIFPEIFKFSGVLLNRRAQTEAKKSG